MAVLARAALELRFECKRPQLLYSRASRDCSPRGHCDRLSGIVGRHWIGNANALCRRLSAAATGNTNQLQTQAVAAHIWYRFVAICRSYPASAGAGNAARVRCASSTRSDSPTSPPWAPGSCGQSLSQLFISVLPKTKGPFRSSLLRSPLTSIHNAEHIVEVISVPHLALLPAG